jgi:hypothetical protein
MVERWKANAFGEVPLGRATDDDGSVTRGIEVGRNPITQDALLSIDTNLAVRFQILILSIARGRVCLQPFPAMLLDVLDIPGRFGQPAIETGLAGGSGKLTGDAAHLFMLSDEKAGQLLGEVPTR